VSVRRFHVHAGDVVDDRLVLREDEAHHARRVLRLPVGAPVVCFDGRGRSWSGRIARYEAKRAIVDGIEPLPEEPSPVPPLQLAQCILKGDRMDLVIQKATELGVARIIPILAERCEPRGDATRRLERWQRVALEAAKQCERGWVPEIEDPVRLEEALERLAGPAVAFVERSHTPLREALAALEGEVTTLTLFVGPEGGWEPAERDALAAARVPCVSLGRRILRAETAAISAIAILDYALTPTRTG
jgi:16S rRNA (uracil1498-N3)-methyltransferase